MSRYTSYTSTGKAVTCRYPWGLDINIKVTVIPADPEYTLDGKDINFKIRKKSIDNSYQVLIDEDKTGSYVVVNGLDISISVPFSVVQAAGIVEGGKYEYGVTIGAPEDGSRIMGDFVSVPESGVHSSGANEYTVSLQDLAVTVNLAISGQEGGASIILDDTPTDGSVNGVKSGGVYDAVQVVQGQMDEIAEDALESTVIVDYSSVVDGVWTLTIAPEVGDTFGMVIAGQRFLLGAQSIELQGFAGTVTVPKDLYVYYGYDGSGPVLTASTTKPEGNTDHHIDIAIFLISEVGTDTVNIRNALVSSPKIFEIARDFWHAAYLDGAKYYAGIAISAAPSALSVGAGQIKNIHKIVSSGAISTSDGFFDIRADNTVTDRNDLAFTSYSDGQTIGVNKYYPVTFGVIANGTTQLVAVVHPKPGAEYSRVSDALDGGVAESPVYPASDVLSKTFVPICMVVIYSGNNQIQDLGDGSFFRDLRGSTLRGAAVISGGVDIGAAIDNSPAEASLNDAAKIALYLDGLKHITGLDLKSLFLPSTGDVNLQGSMIVRNSANSLDVVKLKPSDQQFNSGAVHIYKNGTISNGILFDAGGGVASYFAPGNPLGLGILTPEAPLHVQGIGDDLLTFSLKIQDSNGRLYLSGRDDGQLYHDGPESSAYLVVTADYTLLSSDRKDIICDFAASGGVLTAVLSSDDGDTRTVKVAHDSAFGITYASNGDLIDGQLNVSLAPGEWVKTIKVAGKGLQIIGRG